MQPVGKNLPLILQDGSISLNIQLTGELSTSLLSPGEEDGPKWGTLVAPRVNAQVMLCAIRACTWRLLIMFGHCVVSSADQGPRHHSGTLLGKLLCGVPASPKYGVLY